MGDSQDRGLIVAISGASGAPYARRVLEGLVAAQRRVFLIVSPLGKRLLAEELGLEKLDLERLVGRSDHRIEVLPYNDVGACVASGSFLTSGMVVVPCSSNKLAQIALGLGDNLITRAAQVTLKERRRLVLVHREMPLGLQELRNMVSVTEAGAIVCPANPGFYMRPRSLDDLVTMVAARILDLLEVPHTWQVRWNGSPPNGAEASQ